MPLTVSAGHASHCGQRARNEDFVGMVTPAEPDLSSKGVLAAVADGVSGCELGREAAEYVVRGLLSDYYATPETWSVKQSLERVLQASNSWVHAKGMATTLTCVVLRGGFYYFAHVGDTRLLLLREGKLTRLTTDHVWDRPDMQHVLTRAVGLDSQLAIDHGQGELHAGDVFLLASDGMWAAVTQTDIAWNLDFGQGAAQALDDEGAAAAAAALVQAALAAGSSDNASALVLRVEALPERDLRDSVSAIGHLPAPPRLKPGQEFEGLRVEQLLHDSTATLLYRVSDGERQLVLKTLQSERASDPAERAAFAHEEWLARRAVARFFAQVITPPQRNYLYYLSTWHEGASLQAKLDTGHHFTVPESITLGEQLLRAVGALHRRSIIHRDIKPDNVHLGADGQLRLLDLGVAQSGLSTQNEAPLAGTPSYLAPEQFEQLPASAQSDLYAVGVTLYHALTRHYPYGEVEPFQRPRFGEPARPTRYRPDIPAWLEHVLLKAVAADPKARFETAEECLLAFEHGALRPLPPPAARPLAQRHPWRVAALLSMAVNALLLYLLLRH